MTHHERKTSQHDPENYLQKNVTNIAEILSHYMQRSSNYHPS